MYCGHWCLPTWIFDPQNEKKDNIMTIHILFKSIF